MNITPIIIAILGSNALFTFIQFIITNRSTQTKILKCLLREELVRKIDKCKEKGKTREEDFAFGHYIKLYREVGNGNSESLIEQWNDIPFKEE